MEETDQKLSGENPEVPEDAGAAEEVVSPEPELPVDTETPGIASEEPAVLEEMSAEQFIGSPESPEFSSEDATLKALIEAIIYVTDEPLTPLQIAKALEKPADQVRTLLGCLVEEYADPRRGICVREVAGGFSMGTKPEHHEEVRKFVKTIRNTLKLSPAALETLACIAYKQPLTAPEILEIRGVQGTGVLKTLLDRKLITTAGRKNVVGKPILYKTTKEFLKEFGLKDLAELPTLKEFEELSRVAMPESEADDGPPEPAEDSTGAAEAPAAEASLEPDTE